MALDLRQPYTHADSAPSPSTSQVHHVTIERVIVALRERLSQPLSLGEMADIACLSPFHFNRVFRRTTGIPPYEFLASLRMDAARRVLLTSDLSVTDVCFELGYGSLGTFTSRFAQRIGLPPGQLRRQAETFAPPARTAPDDEYAARVLPWHHAAGLSGRIEAPPEFDGLIFVGLFPSAVPQGPPVAGTLLTMPGAYHLRPVPAGRYHLLVAAVPHAAGARGYLLPGDNILIATSERPVVVRAGLPPARRDVWLRRPRLIDPPVLVSLPYLLA
jgi:AraC-like DNA-binding protein